MQKEVLRILSIISFFTGLILLFAERISITGAVVGALPSISGFLGPAFLFVSAYLTAISHDTLEETIQHLHKKIQHQRQEHRGSPKYLQGLNAIEQAIEQEELRYQQSLQNPHLQETIRKRINRWNEAIDERERHFFSLPHHVKGVVDLPDRGLYGYHPIEGKKSRFIELEVTHYTDQNAYGRIKDDFQKIKDRVMFRDDAGWAYFAAEPLPDRLKTRELRRILGTGLQDYVPFSKMKERNPESVIKFRIRVPKERVLTKTQTYTRNKGGDITVKKYAIAGGISSSDIVDEPVGWRYLNSGLDEQHAKKEKWTRV